MSPAKRKRPAFADQERAERLEKKKLAAREELMSGALLLTVEAAAVLLGTSRRTLLRLVDAGKAPRPVHFGRATRWRREDLAKYAAEKLRAGQEVQP